MIHVCSWCGTELYRDGKSPILGVTDTICPPCVRTYFPEVADIDRAPMVVDGLTRSEQRVLALSICLVAVLLLGWWTA